MFETLINSYAEIFTWDAFKEAVFSPESAGIIFTLIILEGLLSADNAIVLAVMVKHLPPVERRKALMYGLVGAYIFRFIAIGIGVFLVELRWVQVLGGLYLIYLAVAHFYKSYRGVDESVVAKPPKSFWATVISLQLMDIAFSIDSIIAAFGISQNMWILLIGGMLGILMMRGVATLFLRFIERVPELEAAAFALISIIGVKMIAGAYGHHIPQAMFFALIVGTFVVTFIIHHFRKKKNPERYALKNDTEIISAEKVLEDDKKVVSEAATVVAGKQNDVTKE